MIMEEQALPPMPVDPQGVDPQGVDAQRLDPKLITTEVMDIAQNNPKEFKDSLLTGLEEIDPQLVAEFKAELSAMQLPMEVINFLQLMLDEILANPNNYEQIRAKYLAQDIPEELLPEIFDGTFFGGLELALSELAKTSVRSANLDQPMQMASGGIASLGRYGDTMLAHITPSEARLLKRMGGSGTINPQTGLPEFFIIKAVKSALKGVGRAVNKLAKNDIGRIALTIGATYLMGPVGGSLFTNAAAATAFNAAAANTLVSLASGQNLKDSLKEGIFAGATAGFGQALGSKLPSSFGTPVVRRGIASGLVGTGMGLVRGQDLNQALKGGLGALGSSFGQQILGNVFTEGRTPLQGFREIPTVYKVSPDSTGMTQTTELFDEPNIKTEVTSPANIRDTSGNVIKGARLGDQFSGRQGSMYGEQIRPTDAEYFAPKSSLLDPVARYVGETKDFFQNKFFPSELDKLTSENAIRAIDKINQDLINQDAARAMSNVENLGQQAAKRVDSYSPSDKSTRLLESGVPPVNQVDASPSDGFFKGISTRLSKLNPFSEKGFLPGTREEFFKNKLRTEFAGLPEAEKQLYNNNVLNYLKDKGPSTFDIYGPVGATGLAGLAASGGFSAPELEESPNFSFDSLYTGTDYIRDNPQLFARRFKSYTPYLYAKGGIAQEFPRKTGAIRGPGTGTSDDIPAMLSDGEFVMTAKAVRNMGGGSRRKGAAKMYKMMKELETRTA